MSYTSNKSIITTNRATTTTTSTNRFSSKNYKSLDKINIVRQKRSIVEQQQQQRELTPSSYIREFYSKIFHNNDDRNSIISSVSSNSNSSSCSSTGIRSKSAVPSIRQKIKIIHQDDFNTNLDKEFLTQSCSTKNNENSTEYNNNNNNNNFKLNSNYIHFYGFSRKNKTVSSNNLHKTQQEKELTAHDLKSNSNNNIKFKPTIKLLSTSINHLQKFSINETLDNTNTRKSLVEFDQTNNNNNSKEYTSNLSSLFDIIAFDLTKNKVDDRKFSIKKNKLVNNLRNFEIIDNNSNNNDIYIDSNMGQKLFKYDQQQQQQQKQLQVYDNKEYTSSGDYESECIYDYNDIIIDHHGDLFQNKKPTKKDFSLLKYSLSFPVTFNNNYTDEEIDEIVEIEASTTTATTPELVNTTTIENINSILNDNNDVNEYPRSKSSLSTSSKQETLDLLLKSIHKLTSSSELSTRYKIPLSKSTIVISNNNETSQNKKTPITTNQQQQQQNFVSQQFIDGANMKEKRNIEVTKGKLKSYDAINELTNKIIISNDTTTTETIINDSHDEKNNIIINNNQKINSNISSSSNKTNEDPFNVLNKQNSILNEFEKLTKECFHIENQHRDNSSSSSNFKTSQKSINELKQNSVIGKAIVVKDYTPSPYDLSSLTIKKGDIIEIIDMNESGIWTGILNNKIGTFKFINVNIIEKLSSNFIVNSTKPPQAPSKHNQQQQQKLKLSKSLTFSSLFLSSSASITSKNCSSSSNNNNNNNLNLINTDINNSSSNYINLIKSIIISESTLIDEILNKTQLKAYISILNSNSVYTCRDYIKIVNENFLINLIEKQQQQEKNIEDLILIKDLLQQQLNRTTTTTSVLNDNNESHTTLIVNKFSESEKSSSINNINLNNDFQVKVKYRQTKSNMGQKLIKSADIDEQYNNLNIDPSNSNLIRTKLNHHDSALSNDSGCYSNADSVDRYSSPSNSSVLCLFDQQTQTQQQQQHPQSTIIENQQNNEDKQQQQQSTITNKTIKPPLSPFFRHKIKKPEQQQQQQTKVIIHESNTELTRSVSSLDLFNNSHSSSSHMDNLKIKIDLLYKQINHILHLKSKLGNNTTIDGSPKKSTKSSTKNKRNTNKAANFNYHSKVIIHQKNSTIINKLSSLKNSNKTYLARSHTFNANDNIYLSNENNANNKNKSNKIGKYLIKNGRKFFIWKKAGNNCNLQEDQQQQQQELITHQDKKIINRNNKYVNGLLSNDLSNNLVGLIAAKLLSENIDLTKNPYTDDLGFCSIPPALIRRYSFELKQPIAPIAKAFEIERLNQLEQIGKLGIPNDFIDDSCKCLRTKNQVVDEKFQYKKCDLNSKNVELFFISLGLPMYIEQLTLNNQLPLTIKNLCDIGGTNENLNKIGIFNQSHVEILINAIDDLKKLI